MGELHIEGIHTTVPAAELVLHTGLRRRDPFHPLVGEEVGPERPGLGRRHLGHSPDAPIAQTMTVEVNGRKFEVKALLPEGFVGAAPAAGGGAARPKPKTASSSGAGVTAHHRADAGHIGEGEPSEVGDASSPASRCSCSGRR